MVSLFFVKMCFSLLTPTRRCGFNAIRIRKSPREHFSVAFICCNSTPTTTTTKDDDENIQEVDGRIVWSVSRWDEGAKICISSGWLNNYKKLRILMKHFRSFSVSQLFVFSRCRSAWKTLSCERISSAHRKSLSDSILYFSSHRANERVASGVRTLSVCMETDRKTLDDVSTQSAKTSREKAFQNHSSECCEVENVYMRVA